MLYKGTVVSAYCNSSVMSLREEVLEFEASLGYIKRLCLKTNKQKNPSKSQVLKEDVRLK